MKYLPALALIFAIAPCFSQSNTPAIIPEPVSIVQKQGVFTLQDNISISIPANDNEVAKVAGYLSQAIAASTGYKSNINNGNAGQIQFIIAATQDKELGNEGYKLVVSPETATLTANTAAGLFYGVQSFLQLLPREITSKSVIKNVSWTTPCVEIRDYPRFGWRGLMFDVSRHFFTKEEVKGFIDDMA